MPFHVVIHPQKTIYRISVPKYYGFPLPPHQHSFQLSTESIFYTNLKKLCFFG